MESIIISMDIFKVQDEQVFVDSRDVASYYGMRHDVLLKAIDDKLEVLTDLRNHNIMVSSYKVEGNRKSYKCYLLDKRGFYVISMGLTGERAARVQLAFTDAFFEMEKSLTVSIGYVKDLERKLARVEGTVERKALTKAIQEACMILQINFGSITNETYIATYNQNASLLRDKIHSLTGVCKSKINIREYLSEEDLRVIGLIENMSALLLDGERMLTVEQIVSTIRAAVELVKLRKNNGLYFEAKIESIPASKIRSQAKSLTGKKQKELKTNNAQSSLF